MQNDRLRKFAYLFTLPLMWWGSISAAGPPPSTPTRSQDFEFIPVPLHASRDADYSTDPAGFTIAPIDLSIIRDVLADRALENDQIEIILSDVEPQSAAPEQDDDKDNETGEDMERAPNTNSNGKGTGKAKNPGNSGNANGKSGDNGNGQDKENKGNSGNSGNGNSGSGGNGKGKSKDNDDPGGNGNGNNGNGNGNGKGKK